MDARNYSEATKKALFTLSLGRCYEPACPEKVVRMADDGTPVVQVQIAHIHAATKGGPRGGDTSVNNDARRGFGNLLLLCTFHHKLVDNLPTGNNYSVAQLVAWKTEREGEMSDDLRMLTEDRLIDILGSSLGDLIRDTKARLLGAIGEVHEVSHENATLLRTLVDETFKRPHLDPAAVASLADSADILQGVSEYAPMLHESSTSLSHSLPDFAPMLARSSSQLVTVADYIGMLHEASRNLAHLPDYAPMFAQSTERLTNAPDWAIMLMKASDGLSPLPYYAPMLERSCRILANVPHHADVLNSAATDVSNTTSDLRLALQELDNLRHMGYATKLYDVAQLVAQTAGAINDAAAVAAAGQRPDRLTWFVRGFLACLAILAILALVIWIQARQP